MLNQAVGQIGRAQQADGGRRIHQAISAHLNTQRRWGVIIRTERLLRPRQAVTISERGETTTKEIAGFKPCSARSELHFATVAPIVFPLLCGPATAALPPQKPDPAESRTLSSIKLHLVSNPPRFRRPGRIYSSLRLCVLFLCGKESKKKMFCVCPEKKKKKNQLTHV